MKIEVKLHHIEKGVCNSAWSCPIALALLDAKVKSPTVCVQQIVIDQGKSFKRIKTPKKAQTVIKRFDAGESVRPFSFELEAK